MVRDKWWERNESKEKTCRIQTARHNMTQLARAGDTWRETRKQVPYQKSRDSDTSKRRQRETETSTETTKERAERHPESRTQPPQPTALQLSEGLKFKAKRCRKISGRLGNSWQANAKQMRNYMKLLGTESGRQLGVVEVKWKTTGGESGKHIWNHPGYNRKTTFAWQTGDS